MSLQLDLSGRVAVVTGAGGGIGETVARTLREAGAAVALADVNTVRLAELAEVGLGVTFDLTDETSVRGGLDRVEAELGTIDVLVNNAAVSATTLGMPFTNQTPTDWERVLGVNLIGTFVVSKAVATRMVDRGRGAIVNIASVSGRTGFQTDPAYSASKAGTINFTQVMARDLAGWGIRVNAVAPGMVFTPFYREQHAKAAAIDPAVAGMTAEEYFADKASRLIPLQRGQDSADIAHAVAFLASDLARNITGQTLNVDGGLVMS
jgi:2-hydroxycyclohexanecarboxyl-CoA dehydrogenase